MGYQLTSATDVKDMLAKIATFASSNSWTVVFDDSSGSGGVGGQIGLSLENCHVALGEQNATQNPINVTDTYPTPSVVRQDYRIYMALATSLNPATPRFWGHPGSPVTSSTNSNRITVNDLGAASELHLFAGDDYIWCVARTQGEHYTSFGFGHLDRKGMTTPKTAFCAGDFHEWWDNANEEKAAFSGATGHAMFQWNRGLCAYFRVAAGTADPAFGYPSTEQFLTNTSNISAFMIGRSRSFEDYTYNLADACVLSHVPQLRNASTTGGMSLFSMPIFWKQSSSEPTVKTYLGDYPGVRLCDISDVSLGEPVLFGTDEWLPFPWKRRSPWGAPYLGLPSTYGMGCAFLKED